MLLKRNLEFSNMCLLVQQKVMCVQGLVIVIFKIHVYNVFQSSSLPPLCPISYSFLLIPFLYPYLCQVICLKLWRERIARRCCVAAVLARVCVAVIEHCDQQQL